MLSSYGMMSHFPNDPGTIPQMRAVACCIVHPKKPCCSRSLGSLWAPGCVDSCDTRKTRANHTLPSRTVIWLDDRAGIEKWISVLT